MLTIYDLLSNSEKEKVIKKSYKKNDIIFAENSICDSVCIVYSGIIKISSYSFNGSEIVYNTILPGGMFGNNLVFSSHPEYKGNVISKTKSTIYYINKRNLLEILQSNQLFLQQYLKMQSDFGKHLNEKIKIISYNSAIERLDYLFYINNNVIKIHSVSGLSDTLGLTREATSRMINKAIKEGNIKKEGRTLIKLIK